MIRSAGVLLALEPKIALATQRETTPPAETPLIRGDGLGEKQKNPATAPSRFGFFLHEADFCDVSGRVTLFAAVKRRTIRNQQYPPRTWPRIPRIPTRLADSRPRGGGRPNRGALAHGRAYRYPA